MGSAVFQLSRKLESGIHTSPLPPHVEAVGDERGLIIVRSAIGAFANIDLDVLVVVPLGDIYPAILVADKAIQRQHVPGTLTLQPAEELPVVDPPVIYGGLRRLVRRVKLGRRKGS
jgi:hypothetical protein